MRPAPSPPFLMGCNLHPTGYIPRRVENGAHLLTEYGATALPRAGFTDEAQRLGAIIERCAHFIGTVWQPKQGYISHGRLLMCEGANHILYKSP